MDSVAFGTSAAQRALLMALEVSLPILAAGMIVGFLVSIVQAVTQIQEQMLSFIPKILAMGAVLYFLLPWLLSVMAAYTREVLGQLGSVGAS